MAIQQLRMLLSGESGGPGHAYSDAATVEEVAKRVSSGRWTLVVVDLPSLKIEGADATGGAGAGAGGAGGAGGKAGQDPSKTTKKTWVEVELLDKQKRPIKGAKVEITVPDGTTVSGVLTDKGSFRTDGIDQGTCKVRFPDIDGREWSKASAFAEGSAVQLNLGKPKIPAGPYTVKQGDHIASIAHEAGFLSWKTVWDDGKNAAIRNKRNPNVLYPGDVIEIPAIQKKEESVPTTEYHTFQTTGDPVQLKIVVLDWSGNAVVDTEVEVALDDGEKMRTAGDGSVKRNIDPAGKKEGNLKLKGYELELKVGHLDPVEELSGQIWRLNNLGYRAGTPKDNKDPVFLSAVEEFQCDYGLSVDGICGPATQGKLKEIHGS
jgi:hypothetical protein